MLSVGLREGRVVGMDRKICYIMTEMEKLGVSSVRREYSWRKL